MSRNVNDIINKLSPAQRKRVEARAAHLIGEEMTLQQLRRALKLTQQKIAKSLRIGQEGVSKIEKRSDLLISTLRSYVEAMGGNLSLIAQFPDRAPVVLSGMAGGLKVALEEAEKPGARLFEPDIKSLISESVSSSDPVAALGIIAEVEAEIADRELPEPKKARQAARKQIDSLDHEHYFIISDAKMPTLAQARVAMLKWLWARALYKAKGNARDAAAQLDVTPTYIRKLTKLIPRDMPGPGRKRPMKRRGERREA